MRNALLSEPRVRPRRSSRSRETLRLIVLPAEKREMLIAGEPLNDLSLELLPVAALEGAAETFDKAEIMQKTWVPQVFCEELRYGHRERNGQEAAS